MTSNVYEHDEKTPQTPPTHHPDTKPRPKRPAPAVSTPPRTAPDHEKARTRTRKTAKHQTTQPPRTAAIDRRLCPSDACRNAIFAGCRRGFYPCEVGNNPGRFLDRE